MQGTPVPTPAQIGAQPLDADLTAIAALSNADGNFIVGNGSTWVAESGATARASLGIDVRCLARVTFNGVTLAITSSFNVSNITSPLAGVYTVNLANALASANYSVVAHAQKTGDYPRLVGAPISERTTTSLLVAVSDRSVAGTWENVENIDVLIFGA